MKTVTVDNKKRVRLPDAKPGDVVCIEPGPQVGSWILTPVVKVQSGEKFPRGSLLKYMTPERDKEQEAIYKGCVKGPE